MSWNNNYGDGLRAGRPRNRGLIPTRDFLFYTASTSDLRPTQPPTQRLLGAVFSFSAKVKNVRSYTSVPMSSWHGTWLSTRQLYLYLTNSSLIFVTSIICNQNRGNKNTLYVESIFIIIFLNLNCLNYYNVHQVMSVMKTG
jgi:hypothetical protein